MNTDFPRIHIDQTDGSPFAQIHHIAVLAADAWTFGPDGPYRNLHQTQAETTRGQVRDGLLHLLELGLITIDEDRLDDLYLIPIARDSCRPEETP